MYKYAIYKCVVHKWTIFSPGPTTPLPCPLCPLPGPTSPFPRPTLPPPNIFFICMLLCVVLYCFEQNQSRECISIVHGHVWREWELFIKIGTSYFSIISN